VNLFLMIFMYCCPYCVVYVPDLLSFFFLLGAILVAVGSLVRFLL
jgi:hypothetical protein